MPQKLPSVQVALALLADLDAQGDDEPDVQRSNYRGPVPLAALVAVIKDLRQRVAALEAKVPGA